MPAEAGISTVTCSSVQGLGSKVQSIGFKVKGVGCGVWGEGFMVDDLGCRV